MSENLKSERMMLSNKPAVITRFSNTIFCLVFNPGGFTPCVWRLYFQESDPGGFTPCVWRLYFQESDVKIKVTATNSVSHLLLQ